MKNGDHELTTNWRAGTSSQFESNWSKLHKFAYLNHVDSIQIKTSLCGDEWGLKPHCWGKKTGQLLYPGHFSPRRLISAFRASEDSLKNGWIQSHLSTDHSMSGIHALTLRYCPDCIQQGYHSPLYQMSWITRCPVHDVPLSESCPSCGQFIGLTLTNHDFVTPYGCKCNYLLWPGRDSPVWENALTRPQEELIKDVLT